MITRRGAISPAGGAPALAGYPGAVLLDAPKAYYRTLVDDTAPDASGNGHHGTHEGVALISGPAGDAFDDFDHIGLWPKIVIPNSLVIDGNKSITIEMFYKITQDWQNNSAFTIGNRAGSPTDSGARCQAHMPYSNGIYWDYGDWQGIGRTNTYFGSQEDNTWHHITLTVDEHGGPGGSYPGMMEIWFDGVSATQSYWRPQAGENPLVGGYIGRWPASNGNPTSGSIAEFAVYDKALTSAQINAHIDALSIIT